jgi:hypothetical protein
LLEAGIVGGDAFRPLPGFRDRYDVAVRILVGTLTSKLEASRSFILNAFFLFLAS